MRNVILSSKKQETTELESCEYLVIRGGKNQGNERISLKKEKYRKEIRYALFHTNLACSLCPAIWLSPNPC